MRVDVTEAKVRCNELWREGESKHEIVDVLNNEFEHTFFHTTTGIFAVNEPDYAPPVEVMLCRG